MKPGPLASRWWTLLVLVLLGWALLQWARSEDTGPSPPAGPGPLHPGLDPTQVTRLSLQLTLGQAIELERLPGQRWEITFPTRELARQGLVDQVLDNLVRARAESLPASGPQVRPRDVGLEPPRHVIGVGHGDHMATVLLGDPEPLGRYLYARRQGRSEILLVTNNLTTWLKLNGDEWVEPALLRRLEGALTRVRLERPPDGVVVDAERVGGRWVLRAPRSVQADQGRIDQLVQVMRSVDLMRVANSRPTPAQLHDMGLPDAAEAARGELRGATLLQLGAEGQPDDRAYLAAGWQQMGDEILAARADLAKVLFVPAGALALLNNPPDWFRDHRLLPPVRARASRLGLVSEGQMSWEIRRGKDGRWLFQAPERLAGEEVEAHRVDGRSPLSDLLESIDRLRLEGFVDPPAGAGNAELILGWDQAGRARLDRVTLFERDAGPLPARSSARPGEGLLVQREVLALLDPLLPDRLRSLAPLSVPRETWAGLVLELPEQRYELHRGPDGQGWSGDDAWGRRFGLGLELQRGFRGYRWQAARENADYPWSVRFLDAAGTSLGWLRFRLPGPDEEDEAHGLPAAVAACDGYPGMELVVPRRLWVDALRALPARPVRPPAPGADG